MLRGHPPSDLPAYPNNILSYDRNRPAGSSWYHKPRGSWLLQEIYALEADNITRRRPGVTDNVVYVTYKVTEPLLLSALHL